jgi:hypothetical protein
VKNLENERLEVDVEVLPVQLTMRNGREGIRAEGMPYGISPSPEEHTVRINYEEDEMEERETKVVSGQGRMSAKITVYNVNGNLVEVRIVAGQEEMLSLLDQDITPVLT